MTSEDCSNRPQGLADLFRAHGKGLAGAVRGVLGSRADVQEVVQDAFLRALRAQRRGAVPDDPVAWIFVITINLAKDRRRRRSRGADRSLEEVPEVELHARSPAPVAALEAEEAHAAARSAIQTLSDAEKEVFLLRVSGNLSFPAAARALGIPVGTAKTRMRAALAHLRRALAAFAPEPAGTDLSPERAEPHRRKPS